VRSLRIGVDAREVLGDATGVGRYLGELLRRWTGRVDAGTRRFVLYAPEPVPLALPPETIEVRVIGGPGGRGTWWEQISLRHAVRRDSLDVFFAPAYTAPLGIRVPFGVTIHDVSFVAHPEWFRPRERLRRRWLTVRAAQSASVIFTDSEFSRGEIEKYLSARSSRIRVIPPGVSPRHLEAALPPERQPLVLYVGTLFNRRRLPHLIEAFAMATRDMSRARLVIVGQDRTWPPQNLAAVAASRGVADRVQLLDYVDEAQLASFYSRAAVFAFLSEYEGFGLTPLEALAARVPVLVVDTPVAREVYGPAVSYVAPDDIQGTARAIRALLSDPAVAAGTLSHAPAVLSRYCWDRAANQTLAALEQAAGEPR
jgi:glycosyltransferase involved in cell wall biosynthesis